jgi:hypothetical protein
VLPDVLRQQRGRAFQDGGWHGPASVAGHDLTAISPEILERHPPAQLSAVAAVVDFIGHGLVPPTGDYLVLIPDWISPATLLAESKRFEFALAIIASDGRGR